MAIAIMDHSDVLYSLKGLVPARDPEHSPSALADITTASDEDKRLACDHEMRQQRERSSPGPCRAKVVNH